MPRLRFWNPEKTADYRFFDRQIREYFSIGGTNVFVHKFIGVQSEETEDKTKPNHEEKGTKEEIQIQDLFFLENRDRKYDKDIYDLLGIYTVNDNDMDLRQFGMFLTGDNIIIYFHYNWMIECLGRKIISGDVLELPHLRETEFLDEKLPAVNKYFVVEDASRAAEGYSITWRHHVWRVRAKAIQNQQEFFDILNRQPLGPDGFETLQPESSNPENLTIGEILSGSATGNSDQQISDTILQEADRVVPYRNFDHHHLWMEPCVDPFKFPPVVFFGDGIPPNGSLPVPIGKKFPTNPKEGDYFLRDDFEPPSLYIRQKNKWRRVEFVWRTPYNPAHRTLEGFINNDKTYKDSYGKTYESKTYLSSAIKPKVDFESPLEKEEEE